MVMIENIHNGQYLDRSEAIRELNVTAIDHIAEIYERGVADVVFRPGIDPVELHWQVSALCFFNVSNRATFSKIFGRDFGAQEQLARLRGKSEEHTSELQSLMSNSYAVFCLKKKKKKQVHTNHIEQNH